MSPVKIVRNVVITLPAITIVKDIPVTLRSLENSAVPFNILTPNNPTTARITSIINGIIKPLINPIAMKKGLFGSINLAVCSIA